MIDFDSFFNKVLEVSDNQTLKSKVFSQKQKSNILYLTNQCNLNCDYCYQKDDRVIKYTITKEEIDEFFASLCVSEKDKVSTVVIFGGEPTLEKELINYIFDLTDSITQKTDKRFALSMTTNGIAFSDFNYYTDFKERVSRLKNHFSLEISYDGKGQDRRVFKNGTSSRCIVENVLKYVKVDAIRYTIHKDNYDSALEDIISLCMEYPKIVVNFYEQELDSVFSGLKSKDLPFEVSSTQEYKEYLKKRFEYIFTRLKKPICHLACKTCMGCNYEEFDGINYNSKFEVNENAGEFNHFTKLKG